MFGFGRLTSLNRQIEDETVFSDDPTYFHDDDEYDDDDDDLFTEASSRTMETRLFDDDDDDDDDDSRSDDDDETYLDDDDTYNDDEGTYTDGMTTKTSHSQYDDDDDTYNDDVSSSEEESDGDDTFDDRTPDTYDQTTVGVLSDEDDPSIITADTRTTSSAYRGRGQDGHGTTRSGSRQKYANPSHHHQHQQHQIQDRQTIKSLNSSRSAADADYSHSFASDATEERAHVSSPRATTTAAQRKSSRSSRGRATSPTDRAKNRTTVAPQQLHQPLMSPTTSIAGSTATFATQRVNNHSRSSASAGVANQKQVDMESEGDAIFKHDEELMRFREKAKAEFSVGSAGNRRYYPTTGRQQNEETAKSGASLRVLDRNEIFHASAAAAVASLLNPTTGGPNQKGGDTNHKNSNNGSDSAGIVSKSSSGPFTAPSTTDMSVSSEKNGNGPGVGTTTVDGESLAQQLLTKRTENRLEQIKSRMKDPTQRLTDLMAAIASPDNDEAFDRHYMVRRKNACGALQVLTANPKHRVNICWTVGVLPALTSVLVDCGLVTSDGAFSDPDVRRDYIEARNRAVAALVNLSSDENNKLPMFHSPRLIASIIGVINQDDGESRRGCCMILANLGKSKENRLLMAQVPGLLDCVTAIIRPMQYLQDVDSEDDSKDGSLNDGDGPDVFDRVISPNDEALTTANGTEQKIRHKSTSYDPAEASARYDEDPNELMNQTRQYVFALLIHLVKQKDNGFVLARHTMLLDTLLQIAKLQESISQHYGLQILAHLTRHRGNSKLFVFKNKAAVPTIVYALGSENSESRKYACFCLQNLSQDKPCRQELALVQNLLSSICRRIRNAKDSEEKLAALHTLKNLTDEPANLIPMTNTPECFATLMQVAHASDDSVTEMMQYLGCDALATLSHWFRSIATSGQRIGTDKRDISETVKDNLFVPSLKVVRWEPWQ
jgi:segregation and condensation protein B